MGSRVGVHLQSLRCVIQESLTNFALPAQTRFKSSIHSAHIILVNFLERLAFTSKQLNPDLLAGLLNQAFIESEVEKSPQGFDYVRFSLNGMQCRISVQGDTVQLSQSVRIENQVPREAMLRVVEYINCRVMHSKYAGTCDDGSHLISHHYGHWIPEDETITAAYIVKLVRSFVRFQEKQLGQWASNAQAALSSQGH